MNRSWCAGALLLTLGAHRALAQASDSTKTDSTKHKPEPFAFADFSWLNGNSRENPVIDTKYFTGEIRVDASYI